MFAAVYSKAQDAEKVYRHQLSLNATSFIGPYLTFNGNVVSNSPYLLTYKNINKGRGLRTAIGGTFNSRSQNPGNGNNLSKNANGRLSFRIGYEFQEELSKRWLYYVGIDAVYGYELSRTKTSVVQGFPPQNTEIITGTENFGFGGGPVFGLEFKLGKRISLNTETTVYLTYNEIRSVNNNPGFPSFSSTSFTASTAASIVIPTSIFFVFHF